jgi:hypothetical protein
MQLILSLQVLHYYMSLSSWLIGAQAARTGPGASACLATTKNSALANQGPQQLLLAKQLLESAP